ncbi:DUF3954 domain-containing protein [Cytobacillus sp. Hm23]
MKNTNTAEIDTSENKVIVIKNGKLIEIEPPDSGYGEQSIQWQGGNVKLVKTTKINQL